MYILDWLSLKGCLWFILRFQDERYKFLAISLLFFIFCPEILICLLVGSFLKMTKLKCQKDDFFCNQCTKHPLKYTTATVQKCENSNIVLHQAPNATFYSKTKGEIDRMTSFLREVHTEKIILEEPIILIIRCNFFDKQLVQNCSIWFGTLILATLETVLS